MTIVPTVDQDRCYVTWIGYWRCPRLEQQLSFGGAIHPRLGVSPQVGERSQRHNLADLSLGASRRPERQMPASRMSDDGNLLEFEAKLRGEIKRHQHVVRRAGPSATATDSSILDVPGIESASGQVDSQ